MAAPGWGFNIEPITAATSNPLTTFNQGIEFSTGAFSVGAGSTASQIPGVEGLNSVALIAGVLLIGVAFYFRGAK